MILDPLELVFPLEEDVDPLELVFPPGFSTPGFNWDPLEPNLGGKSVPPPLPELVTLCPPEEDVDPLELVFQLEEDVDPLEPDLSG